MPSAGLHIMQPIIGLGETHSLAYSSPKKISCIFADIRNCCFRSVWSSGISASRRKIRRNYLKTPGEFGNSLDSSRFYNPGCLNLAWSQWFPLTSTHAHNNGNISSPSAENPRFDSEGDIEYAEKKRYSSVFQDYVEHSDGEEPQWQKMRDHADSTPNPVRATDLNGGYMNEADLFREGSRSVWPEEESVEDNEGDTNSVGYESWGEESEKSTNSGSSGSVVSTSGSAADSLAIGGKEPVYQVGPTHFKMSLCIEV